MATIAFASDHAGYGLKNDLMAALEKETSEGTRSDTLLDLGTDSADISVDYPDFGSALATAVADGRADFGIAVCGTGIGISIAANRNTAVRAALCHDVTTARFSREHNDANILALGARVIGPGTALDCVRVFLNTSFEGGRHTPRVSKLARSE